MKNIGTLYLVGTPIGNVADASLRARKILDQAEVIVCEDTRVTNILLRQLEILKQQSLFRLDENVQMRMVPKVINWLETGTDVALVTDAGMPCISDPGWRVVNAVREAEYPVEVIPGPSALDTAVVASGMDSSRVWFGGFLPKKEKHQTEVLLEVDKQLMSGFISMAVIYESPKRVRATLELIGDKWQVAACAELTKIHQKVLRGTTQEVIEQLPMEVKGEWVLVWGKV